jgi:hypothetical protein
MANYAFLDENNIVVDVIAGRDEDEIVDGISDWEKHYGDYRGLTCKRTSKSGKIRFNYAGIGYTYDPIDDAFIAPKPYSSWILNSKKQWEPPVTYPTDGKFYGWNEETGEWYETEVI